MAVAITSTVTFHDHMMVPVTKVTVTSESWRIEAIVTLTLIVRFVAGATTTGSPNMPQVLILVAAAYSAQPLEPGPTPYRIFDRPRVVHCGRASMGERTPSEGQQLGERVPNDGYGGGRCSH